MKKNIKLLLMSILVFLGLGLLLASCNKKQNEIIDNEIINESIVEEFATEEEIEPIKEETIEPIKEEIVEDSIPTNIDDIEQMEKDPKYIIEESIDYTYGPLYSISYNSGNPIVGDAYAQVSSVNSSTINLRYVFEIKTLDCDIKLTRTVYPSRSAEAYKVSKEYDVETVYSSYYNGEKQYTKDGTWFVLYTMRNIPLDYWDYDLDVKCDIYQTGTEELITSLDTKTNSLTVLESENNQILNSSFTFEYENANYSISGYTGSDNLVKVPAKSLYKDSNYCYYVNVTKINSDSLTGNYTVVLPNTIEEIEVGSFGTNTLVCLDGTSVDLIENNSNSTIYPYSETYNSDSWFYKDSDTIKLWIDTVHINASNGTNEAIVVSFNVNSTAEKDDFNIYYAKNDDNYTVVDDNLIFIENGVATAYIIGLSVGTYSVKVELANDTSENEIVSNIKVTAQDKSGYAHFNYTNGVGAYNDDGTLKDNAVVVYVTNENKNTVKAEISGVLYTGLANIIQNANPDYPLDIRILDSIKTNQWSVKSNEPRLADNTNLQEDTFWNNTFETTYGENLNGLVNYCMDKYKKITYKYKIVDGENVSDGTKSTSQKTTTYKGDEYSNLYGKSVYDDDSYFNMLDVTGVSNVTIEGIGNNAEIFQWGFTWYYCSSIEIKNLTFTDNPEDACSFEGSGNSQSSVNNYAHYWIHNCTFNKGKNNWDVSGERDKYAGDGSTDFKFVGYVTSSYNRFNNCKKTGLVGGSDDNYDLNITFHHNFYNNVGSRLPLGRQANMHFYNNYYYNCSTCQDIRSNAFVLSEYNVFDGSKNCQLVSSSAVIKSFNDSFSGDYNSSATIVENRTEALSGNCKPDGSTDYTNFDTNQTLFYYDSVNGKSDVSILTSISDLVAFVTNHSGSGDTCYNSLNLNENRHKVTYLFVDENGVTKAQTQTRSVLNNSKAPVVNPAISGYEVNNYKDIDDNSYDMNTLVTEDITIKVIYSELSTNTVSFVSYISSTEELISHEEVYYGYKVSQPENPEVDGYMFDGWYTSNEFNEEFDFDTLITVDTKIYAKFVEESSVSTLLINFNNLSTGTITKDTSANNATIKANDSKSVSIKDVSSEGVVVSGESIIRSLALGGSGNETYRSIYFTIPSEAKITAYYKSGTSGRPLVINPSVDSSFDVTNGSIQSSSITNVPAGSYYIYSGNSGIDVYCILIEIEESSSSTDTLNLNMFTISKSSTNTKAGNGIYEVNYAKTIYKVGEQFDSSNLVAIVNDSTITSSNLAITGYSSAAGNHDIEVSYNDATATYTVYVLSDFTNNKVAVGANYSVGGTTTISNETYITFKTIEQALEYLRNLDVTPTISNRATLYITAGYYNEKIEIDIPYLTIIGEGRCNATYTDDESYSLSNYNNATIIEWNSLYGVKENGIITSENFSQHTTDSTQTVAIREEAIACEIKDLTISNWWNNDARFNSQIDYLKTILNPNYDSSTQSIDKMYLASDTKVNEHRALALLVQSDKFVMNNCSLLGYQDTVEFFKGRSYLYNCYISGTTDYIFGPNGTIYIKNSTIHTIYNGNNSQGGYVNAFKGNNGNGTAVTYGAIYDNCIFEADSTVTDYTIALGRPWTEDSAVMIMNSSISSKYSKSETNTTTGGRYVDWNSNVLASNAKFYEYNNSGLGAITSSITGCTVITDADLASNYNNLSTIFGKNNGNVNYSDVWNGTIPTEDTKVYYHFDLVGTSSENNYYWNQSVEGSSANLGNMTIDATSGKFAYNSSGYTQMNQGTKLILTVDYDCSIIITSYSGQYNYKVIVDDVETPANANEFSIDVVAGKTVTIEATSTAYLYNLVISK